MNDNVQKLIDICKEFNKEIEIILIGGQALPYYDSFRMSQDIDFEIHNLDIKEFAFLRDNLKKENIDADFAEDISTFGFIPLPEDYKDKAMVVHKNAGITVMVLHPVDYIITKLFRGSSEDEIDIINVKNSQNIEADEIEKRIEQIKFLKDTETFNFLKRVKLFLKELKEIEQAIKNTHAPVEKADPSTPDSFNAPYKSDFVKPEDHKLKHKR